MPALAPRAPLSSRATLRPSSPPAHRERARPEDRCRRGFGGSTRSGARRSGARGWSSLAAVLLWLSLGAGCDGAPAVPPPPDPDFARECFGPGIDTGASMDGGRPRGCAENEVCIEGRCYARCTAPTDCGPNETCSSSGVCTTGARPDAGPRPDGGPPSSCDEAMCASNEVCHPQADVCVECSEHTINAPPGSRGACRSAAPICDIANGRCVGFEPRACAACNYETDCAALDGSFTATCVLREVMGVREHVCLLPCDGGGTCPAGLQCATVHNLANGTSVDVCVPPAEAPCTTWLARGTSCSEDADCAPLAAPASAIFVGACDGEMPATEDGGTATPGTCLQPCRTTDECMDAAAGEQCLGEGIELFCRIPPVAP